MEFLYKNSCLVKEDEISKTAAGLESYLVQLQQLTQTKSYDRPEGFINLTDDSELLEAVLKIKQEKISPALKYFILTGIGGSNLGAKAVYDALFGYFDLLQPQRYPKMMFADTADPEFLRRLKNLLTLTIEKPAEVIINIISKSGATLETIVNFEIIYEVLNKRFGEQAKNQIIVTTDFGSTLWQKAKEQTIAVLGVPEKVGGRYSVLSAVGLLPLASVGVNIEKLVQGALNMREQCLQINFEQNPALVSAVITFLHFKRGKTINNTFCFHPELEVLGKWYRQLMGESIGKETDLDGTTVNIGITPTVSVGSTDLHSVLQLYLGGPKDKFTTFVYANNSPINITSQQLDTNNVIAIPKNLVFPGLIKNLAGKSVTAITQAIYEGVKIAYQQKALPFVEVLLPEISEFALGEFLQFKMMEMIFLAKLLNVNAFDQPNVELYKNETRRLLNK